MRNGERAIIEDSPLLPAHNTRGQWLPVLTVCVAAGIFGLDLFTPLGITVWLFYVPLMIVALWIPWRPFVWCAAAFCTLLVIAGFVGSPPGEVENRVLTNRLLGVGLIWITASLSYFLAGHIAERKQHIDALQEAHDMLEQRVRDRTAELAKAVQALESEITVRKKAEAELMQRTVETETANKELEAFSYSISHDLRAPLRAIVGFTRVLMEDYSPSLPADAQRYLKIVQASTKQMGHLVDDLLSFSRLSRLPLETRSVAPRDLVEQVLDDLREERTKRQVEVIIGELPLCRADPALLKQVFVNLIENAFKYTRGRDPSRINIASKSDGPQSNGTIYYVKDNGVGFDMQYADKLFGVFQRLHRAEDYEGTGVGLAIVQRIIHRHGGRIWAEAQVDLGAAFYFTLNEGTHHG